MRRVACIGCDDKGRMDPRARPLFNNINLISLEFRSSVEHSCGWVFFEVTESDRIGEHEALVILMRRQRLRTSARV